MEELAYTKRHAQVAEKTQERLQQAIELMTLGDEGRSHAS